MPPDTAVLTLPGDGARPTVDARVARFLTTAERLEESGPPDLARWTVALTGLAVTGFVGWASFAPFKEIAVGRGEILPIGFSRPVQHLEGGIVARVLVREGQAVKAGEVVAVMDDAAVQAELAQAQARRAALDLSIERLQAFAAGRVAELGPGDLGAAGDPFQSIRLNQRAVLDAQMETRQAQILGVLAEIETRRQTRANLTAQIARTQAELDLVRESLARRQGLMSRGLVRLTEVEQLRRDELRMQTELGRVATERDGVENAIGQLEARRAEMLSRLRQDALQEVSRAQVEAAETASAIARLTDRLARLQVPSPVDGVVKDVAVRAPAVIAPGAALVEVVPSDKAVFAEVELSPDDIGHVQRGAEAAVKVSAYDHTRFGSLAGAVETISPATFKAADGRAYFRVRLRLEGGHLGDPARGFAVTPGMAVSAEIRTGEKTLMDYLLKPLRAAVSTAFSER